MLDQTGIQKSVFLFNMAKGNKRQMRRVNNSNNELRVIEDIERKFEIMRLKREESNSCVPIVKKIPENLYISDDSSVVSYSGCKSIPIYTSTTIKDTLDANDIHSIDMSSSLMCDDDVMFGLLARHVEEESSILRYYIRTVENCERFAMIQNIVEKLMLGTHLPTVQGAIFHVYGIFYIVAPDTCFEQSECIGVIKSLMSRKRLESNENIVVYNSD